MSSRATELEKTGSASIAVLVSMPSKVLGIARRSSHGFSRWEAEPARNAIKRRMRPNSIGARPNARRVRFSALVGGNWRTLNNMTPQPNPIVKRTVTRCAKNSDGAITRGRITQRTEKL